MSIYFAYLDYSPSEEWHLVSYSHSVASWVSGRYGADTTNEVISVEAVSGTEFAQWQTSIQGLHLDAPGMCQTVMPAGVRWLGLYAALRQTRNGGWRAVTDVNGEPIRFHCPHCAAVEAARVRGGTIGSIVGCSEVYVGASYLADAPEVLGGSTHLDTQTVRVAEDLELPNSCGNCGLLGHNSRSCTRPPKAHLQVGIEIEGRWLDRYATIARASAAGLTSCSDGSVHETPDGTTARPYEIQTHADTLRSAIGQLVSFYPDEADESCGMHVHVSFSATDTTLLCSQEFFDYFRAQWLLWGQEHNLHPRSEFYTRLNGGVEYCRQNVWDDRNAIESGDRYRQLNFCSWSEHRTVECRLLPMFRHRALAISAVQKLLDIYETFLADAAVIARVLPPEIEVVADTTPAVSESVRTIDVPNIHTSERTMEMQMNELLGPAPGHVRVAMTEGMSAEALLRAIRAVAA